jgi:hypothetical protein
MQDQRDDGGTHTIENRGDRLQATEVDVQRTERRHDEEVRQDERPAPRPRAALATAQIGDKDPDLDRQGPGQGLTHGDGLAHLLARQPAALGDELALHLADQRDGAAKPQQTQSQEIAHQIGKPARPVTH